MLPNNNSKSPQHQKAPRGLGGMNGIFGLSVRGFASDNRGKPRALARGGSLPGIDEQRLLELEDLFEYYLEKENNHQKVGPLPGSDPLKKPALWRMYSPAMSGESQSHLRGGSDRTPRVLMQVEILEQPLKTTATKGSTIRDREQKDLSRRQTDDPGLEGQEATKWQLPSWKREDILTRSDLSGRDDKVGPCQTEESKEVAPAPTKRRGIQSANGGLSSAGRTLKTIRHKLPNWAGYLLALTILPLLCFSLGRLTATNNDSGRISSAQAKEQILGLAASPEPKSSAKDYLLEAEEAFKRAQEISQEKELSQEDKNKVTNLINLAIQTLSEGIAKYPNNAALYFKRATIYKALSQATPEMKERVKADLEKTFELAPADPNVLAFYGRFLVEEGQIEKAKALFDQLLQILPKDSKDYQTVAGWRQQLEPTPTPTPMPTATPTETPTPLDTSDLTGPTPTPTLEITPTPESSSSATPTPEAI